MTVMMSDSLKDIISTGQLGGEETHLTVTFGDEIHDLDVLTFELSNKDFYVKSFSDKEVIRRLVKEKKVKVSLAFMGDIICVGMLTSVGYEQVIIGEDVHDVLIIRAKRDN